MNKQQQEQQLLKSIADELEETIDDLDAETRSRLTQIRHQAVARSLKKNKYPLYVPTVALLTACLILAIVILVPARQKELSNAMDDLDLLSSSEDLEFLEDLEFYEWLEENEIPV